MNSSETLFLIDGMPLLYRAYFVFLRNPRLSSSGLNTSAIYGYTNTLIQVLSKEKPSHIAVAFDTKAPTFRHKLFPEYKAQREATPEDIVSSVSHARSITEAFNISVLAVDGYEADDIIGTLSTQADEIGLKTYLVTPDKDFCQLLSTNVFLYQPARANNAVSILGVTEVCRQWGIDKVEQVIDILALAGDQSDNIPGIPRIGEKTAAKLIQEFGSVDSLIAHTDRLKGVQKKSIETYAEQALLCKKLTTIHRRVPLAVSLDELGIQRPNIPRLRQLFKSYEFNTLGKRFFSHYGDDFFHQDLSVESDDSRYKTSADVMHEYRLVIGLEDRQRLIQALEVQDKVCFDCESTGLNPMSDRLIGIAFAYQAHRSDYVPIPEKRSEASAILNEFRGIFTDPNRTLIAHNIKFDSMILRQYGIHIQGKKWDTMLAHYLLAPEQRHAMDTLAKIYLDYKPIPITDLIGNKKSTQRSMTDVPLEQLSEYAAEDADVTLQLYHSFQPLLKSKHLDNLFHDIEMPLIDVLIDMEWEGINIDSACLINYGREFEDELRVLSERIYEHAGMTFNIDSPKQLGNILFQKLGLNSQGKKSKSGQYVTDEQVLSRLIGQHDIVLLILAYRHSRKLKNTYADVLPKMLSPQTGRIHTRYQQTVAATGRIQSQYPNLQNIPIRSAKGKELRKAFIPRDKNHRLLSADYSQIELRIMAELSQDEAMCNAFNAGVDIHRATAARINGIPLDQVSVEMRQQAKMVNFGIIYGISAFGLAQRLRISRQRAASMIEHYLKEYPGIKAFREKNISFAQEHGYVESIKGRRRYIRDIHSQNATTRVAAERNAINAPVQGSAADMIKLAMIRIHRKFHQKNIKSKLLLQVHDELLFDLHHSEENYLPAIIEDYMKNAIPMKVPIDVRIGIGKNWFEAH